MLALILLAHWTTPQTHGSILWPSIHGTEPMLVVQAWLTKFHNGTSYNAKDLHSRMLTKRKKLCHHCMIPTILKKTNSELISHINPTPAPAPPHHIHTSSFIDNTNLFLPLKDIEWFNKCFDTLNKPMASNVIKESHNFLLVPPHTRK